MQTLLEPVAATLVGDITRKKPPSGVVLAIAEGNHVHVSAAGVDDFSTGAETTARHQQDIASVSKILTTLAVLVLVGQGKITLDSTVGTVFGRRAGHHAQATVEDLLRHRAGFRQWWPLYLEPNAAEDPVGAALAVPPLDRPGHVRRYSDLGMQVLGGIVAGVTGQSFARAVHELVLEPLGATTVLPGSPAPSCPVLAGPDGDAIERQMIRSNEPFPIGKNAASFRWRTARIIREPADGNAFHVFRGAGGHAGWFADADGLLRVASALADPRLLGIDQMTADQIATEVDAGQGLGVRRYTLTWHGRGRILLGHQGFTGTFVGAAPATTNDPELRLALLANRLHGCPAPTRELLVDVEALWTGALTAADKLLAPLPRGER